MKAPRRESAVQLARRQAAHLLRNILHGDTTRSANASIKTLIYQPSIRNKKATMALVCQTLKYLPVIKEVLENAEVLKQKSKMHHVEDFYVATYELLFGKEFEATKDIEDFVLARKSAIRAALARLMVKKKVSRAEELLPAADCNFGPRVRYVRVNSLKIEVDKALEMLRETLLVEVDDLVPGLLTLPADIDLHTHSLVLNGSLILQGKASCLPALALAPEADWVVLDACAAPGNKTVQLAALMQGRGQVLACELNEKRIKRLYETVDVAGASNVKVMHQDFLKLDVNDPVLSQVKAILLDPSCSGSGTVYRRLDHLLPSSANSSKEPGGVDAQRIQKLANFQKTALRFALSFPVVERVVYSTCSVHQQENEDVVSAVLDFAHDNGFRLGHPIPQWQQRGLPVFEGATNLLRVKPSEEMDGFFIALFERNSSVTVSSDDLLLRKYNQENDEHYIITSAPVNVGHFVVLPVVGSQKCKHSIVFIVCTLTDLVGLYLDYISKKAYGLGRILTLMRWLYGTLPLDSASYLNRSIMADKEPQCV
ncbi:hypothetical protein GOP47_0023628 [Adiantum capillus-veneris]|uniref:SAM-dependent MTase RsmB/NOP-type domain-containing protein n=1 Tax=Adiantum capillus-veneris TaxID=13818 RepID=A0A9D4U415_ADICA|nr:hypothetical protein GOP47_0023628 [Adiantum capillus-veneris]